MSTVDVIRTYLELTDPGQLRAVAPPGPDVLVVQATGCPPSLWRSLYTEVGRPYHWVDRRGWTDDDIRAYLARPDVSLWLLQLGNATAGYFELCRHPDGSVEIAYFGLLGEFVGRGLGKYLLTVAVERAWELGTSRVWLHTCTLDHPAALPNYLKRGFRAFKTETYTVSR
ncbi:MAG: GNAT family N-acetyltransferase [Gemmatimonadetes bacterium]|nr:GNAT family N-acetyltransferase [Gemmatimonadota bacterium]